jgi:metal-responsive CopG/Arc/MetJ family transcriptional regulator
MSLLVRSTSPWVFWWIGVFREAARRMLEYFESLKGGGYGIFVIAILSDRSVHRASDRRILDVIHEYQLIMKAFYHQLLGDGLCINVAVLEAQWPQLSRILGDLRSVRGLWTFR